MDILKDIYKNYGITMSHAKFVEEFKYLNALYYIVKSVEKAIEQQLKEKVNDARKSSKDGIFALGMVTNRISASEFESIVISGDEAEAISNNGTGFFIKRYFIGIRKRRSKVSGNFLKRKELRTHYSR